MHRLSPPVVALQNNPTSIVCRSGMRILGYTGLERKKQGRKYDAIHEDFTRQTY